MKKKKIGAILFLFMFLVGISSYHVKAEEKLKIIDFAKTADQYSNYIQREGILYSDHQLRIKTWDSDQEQEEIIIPDVKSFKIIDGYPGQDTGYVYHTLDNTLHIVLNNKVVNELENITEYYYECNEKMECPENILYKDTENNLYQGFKEKKQIATNVDKVMNSISTKDDSIAKYNGFMYTTLDGKLFALGENLFGTKINEGLDFNTPYQLLDNIKEFNSKYAITSSGELYAFSKYMPRPKVIAQNVSHVLLSKYVTWITTDPVTGGGADYENYIFFIEKEDKTNTVMNMYDYHVDFTEEKTLDFKPKKIISNELEWSFVFSEDGCLYYINPETNEISLFKKGIIEVEEEIYDNAWHGIYLLDENGTLFGYNETNLSTAFHLGYSEEPVKLLENVASIKYMKTNTIMMKDDSILKFESQTVPKKENERINNNQEIKSMQLILAANKTHLTVEDESEYYATVIPDNAVDKKVIWTSSDSSVVNVLQDGHIDALKVGTATICASVESSENIKECAEVTVHPKPEELLIEVSANKDIEIGQNTILTAKILPEDALDAEIVWTSNDITLSHSYYQNDQLISLPTNQISLTAYTNKEVRVTATIKGTNISKTITLKPVYKVTNISAWIENADDYNDENEIPTYYIDLSNKNVLKLKYEIYPEDAINKNITIQNSNNKVLKIDENGIITAYKTGKSTITLTPENSEVKSTINVVVTNSQAPEDYLKGDINEDGEIDMFDVLLALRIYLNLTEQNDRYEKIGDMDEDGEITIIDVSRILRIYLNLE